MDSNSKSVTSLFIVLALLALLALAVSISKQDDADEQKIFAPQLSAGLNDITAIRVLTGGVNLVADIRRNNDAWLVHNADNYPAKVGALRELLLTLSEAEIVEATTAIEANYARLGVRDISMAEAAGVEVEIDGLSESFAIILGNSSSGNTNFARLTGQEQSWRITGTHSPVRITLDWLDRTLMNFSANDVLSIEIVHGDEETVLVNKAAAGFELAGLTGSEKLLASVLNKPLDLLADGEFGPAFGASRLARLAHSGEATADICTMPARTHTQLPDERWVDYYAGQLDQYRGLYAALKGSFSNNESALSSAANHTRTSQ